MLPEIALTSQFLDRFEARFGVAPVERHSALGAPERGRVWKAVATGQARCVVGARSALFLPYGDLGLIVVDEEHDAGFKQEDRFTIKRATWRSCGPISAMRVVLASATPSIESHVNARTGAMRMRSCRGGSLASKCRTLRPSICGRDPPEKGRWLTPEAGRGRQRDAGLGAADAVVPQPARVCAADAVPQVRTSCRMSAVLGVVGRAPVSQQAQLPSLRVLASDPENVRSARAGCDGGVRARRRAGLRGGRPSGGRGAAGAPV